MEPKTETSEYKAIKSILIIIPSIHTTQNVHIKKFLRDNDNKQGHKIIKLNGAHFSFLIWITVLPAGVMKCGY